MSCTNCGKNDYQQLISAYFGRSSDAILPAKKTVYPLIGNMFEKCSVAYDKDAEELLLADDDQIYKCCLKNCEPGIDFCHNDCNNRFGVSSDSQNNMLFKKCRQKCNTMKENCVTLCTQSRGIWGDKDPFVQESKKIGCWDIPTNKPNPECIRQNKTHLHNYCMRNCYPTANLNCKEHCNTSYNLAVNPLKVSQIFKNTIPQTTLGDLQNTVEHKEPQSMVYILVGVASGVLFAILVYILIRLYNRSRKY